MIQQHIEFTEKIRNAAMEWSESQVKALDDRKSGQCMMTIADPRIGEMFFIVGDSGMAYIVDCEIAEYKIQKVTFISDEGTEVIADRFPDMDLGEKSRDQLIEEVVKLRMAIRYHRDQKGDDRCWLDDAKLYKNLPEGEKEFADFTLPCREKFLGSCQRFWEQRQPNRINLDKAQY